MNIDEYLREVRDLPIPTKKQQENFVDHIMGAHSWYKHLDLLKGEKFVFFLASDVGGGYTPENPRMHYSWKTRDEYISKFGYLDYQWRKDEHEVFNRDFGGVIVEQDRGLTLNNFTRKYLELPDEIVNLSNVTLFPYVSNDGIDAITWHIHEDSLTAIKDGIDHPQKELILKWYEKALICEYEDDTDEELCATYLKLANTQRVKIEQSINTLISWLEFNI
jgi:hypothetical protein